MPANKQRNWQNAGQGLFSCETIRFLFATNFENKCVCFKRIYLIDLHEFWDNRDKSNVEETPGCKGEDIHEKRLEIVAAFKGESNEGAKQTHQRSADLGSGCLPPVKP